MVKGKTQTKTGTQRKTTTTAAKTTVTTPIASSNHGASKTSLSHFPTCCGCGNYVTDDTKALHCDKCQSSVGWKCAECLNLPNNVYDVLVSENGPPLRWFCEDCDASWKKPGDADLMQMMTRLMDKLERIEDRLESEVGSLGRHLEAVEEKVDKGLGSVPNQLKGLASRVEEKVDSLEKAVKTHGKADEAQLIDKLNVHDETVHKRLEDKVDVMMKAIGTQQLQAVQGVVQGALQQDRAEELEIEQRKRNVIVHGVAESEADSSDERVNDDLAVLSAMFHEVGVDEAKVEGVVRLGKKSSDPSQSPRPMKVILDTVDNKVKLLRNAKNLREKQDGGWTKIFVHQDLTPKQREARKPLVAELKQRKANGENDLVIFNGRVVQRKRPQSSNMN